MRLSDTIEQFIKAMMEGDSHEGIELKRNELAEYFHCAPSQINYVLSTRFTPDHGYVTSSQRGGGGCIRIVRIVRSDGEQLRYLLHERLQDAITAHEAKALCVHLVERGIVSMPDAHLMVAATTDNALSAPLPEGLKNSLRARILRSMLLSVAQREAAEGGRT